MPLTCWYSNVRNNVSHTVWRAIARQVASEYNNRCGVCGGRGDRHPVECHEEWSYKHGVSDTGEKRYVQTLEGMIALCPMCHKVKHIGFAHEQGLLHEAIGQLMFVNQWDEDQVSSYLRLVWETWHARNEVIWDLDISALSRYGVRPDGSEIQKASSRTTAGYKRPSSEVFLLNKKRT